MCFKAKKTTLASDKASPSSKSTLLAKSNIASNIAADLSVGLATRTMTVPERQEYMTEKGYSQASIDDYNRRTYGVYKSGPKAGQTKSQADFQKEQMAKITSMQTEYGYKDKYGNITNPALSPEAIAARQQAASPRGLLTGSTASDSASGLASSEAERRKAEIARLKAQQLRRRLEGSRRGRSSLLTSSGGGGGYA